jgi:Protein of unknown function (DUF3298)
MKKHLLTVLLLIPILMCGKPLIFSAECFMDKTDSLSPLMTYDLIAEKIEGLSDTSLQMFIDPDVFFGSNYKIYSRDFMDLLPLYRDFPTSASLQHHFYYEKADVIYSNRRFYSLRYHQSCYTGGAHPNSWSKHWIVNKKSGNILNYEDIFHDNADQKLKALLDKAILKQFKVNNLNDILFSKDYPVSKDIFLRKNGVVFQYDPYEIAPYSTGPIEIFIPYRKIHALLKRF